MLEHLDQLAPLQGAVGVAVFDDRLRYVDGLPTSGQTTKSKVDIFVVQEVLRIEAADRRKVGGVKDHRCTTPKIDWSAEIISDHVTRTTAVTNPTCTDSDTSVLDHLNRLVCGYADRDLTRPLHLLTSDCAHTARDPDHEVTQAVDGNPELRAWRAQPQRRMLPWQSFCSIRPVTPRAEFVDAVGNRINSDVVTNDVKFDKGTIKDDERRCCTHLFVLVELSGK